MIGFPRRRRNRVSGCNCREKLIVPHGEERYAEVVDGLCLSSQASGVPMAAEEKTQIRLGRTKTGFIVRVSGRGTVCESRSLHEFALGIADDESCTLTIDLSQCDYLDSTFLGCLVDLFKRFSNRSVARRFEIIANQERCHALLSATRLQNYFPLCEQPPPQEDDLLNLEVGELDHRQRGQHIMECHRRLAEIGGPNQEVFKRIADQLEFELNKEIN